MENEFTLKVNENIELIQSANGLTFGTDAYLLAAFAKGGAKKTCADLGSGTGIIPLLCASKNKFPKIFALEIQPSFVSIISKNAEINGYVDKIFPTASDVREIRSASLGGEVDVVTANPPYMKVNSGKRNEHDEKFIARHEVCGDICDFCAAAARILKHGGNFYTVWRPDRLCDLIAALRECRLEPKLITFVHATPESQPSMVLVRSKKGAASGCTVTRPLFLHDSRDDAANNKLSRDAEQIYATCSFESFN
ncbi:MAG: SAM-dependent methyltransferase [Ruminococcaceae bacterium]|nr:SAM-dependent methyltransferase [Oscillospiraceae bacterium]